MKRNIFYVFNIFLVVLNIVFYFAIFKARAFTKPPETSKDISKAELSKQQVKAQVLDVPELLFSPDESPVPITIPIIPKKLPIASFNDERFSEFILKNNIDLSGKVIDVSINKMILRMYQDGLLVGEYKIVAVGDPEKSPTVRGSYKMLNKEKLHYSTTYNVWMPWSVRFYDGYYIHGIAYFPDGRPLSGRYSGGCVRLENDIAKKVYDFTDENTRIYTHS